MKIEKSNNPAAAGALILVLILIVGRIAWMLFGQNRTAAAASPVAAASSPPAAVPNTTPTPAAARPRTITQLASATTARNPFAYAVPVRSAPALFRPSPASRDRETVRAASVHVMPLPPLPVWGEKAGATARMGKVSALPGLGLMPIPASRSVPAPTPGTLLSDTNPLQTLKLTAIIDGTAPMAVLQTAQPEPVVLHVGDDLEGMRVIAINENSVVFARGESHWTLPLQSAADGSTPGSISVSSDAVSEEKTDELQ